MRQFGLIGKNISYSFSPSYFREKFEKENIPDSDYKIFDLSQISEVEMIFTQPNLTGLNVTIPYKEEIIPFLDELTPEAETIGAVNTIQFKNGEKIGHNTDAYGFEQSLNEIIEQKKLFNSEKPKALILGTGGSSKAVAFALKNSGISFLQISRDSSKADLCYEEISPILIKSHLLVINTTPLGSANYLQDFPNLPYDAFTPEHLAFDLIYNPSETVFLDKAKKRGANTINGLRMLQLQADKAWKIWNS